jgi:hypothetical protein
MGDAVFGQVNYKVVRSDYRGNDRYAQLQDELNRYGKGGARVVYANIEEGGVNTGASTPDPKIAVTLILMADGPTS